MRSPSSVRFVTQRAACRSRCRLAEERIKYFKPYIFRLVGGSGQNRHLGSGFQGSRKISAIHAIWGLCSEPSSLSSSSLSCSVASVADLAATLARRNASILPTRRPCVNLIRISSIHCPTFLDFSAIDLDSSPWPCCIAAFPNPYVSLKRSRWGAEFAPQTAIQRHLTHVQGVASGKHQQ